MAAVFSNACIAAATGAAPFSLKANGGFRWDCASVAAGRIRAVWSQRGSSIPVSATSYNFLRRNAAEFEAPNCIVAASFHTSGGGVDRNDAAPTGPLLKPDPKILLEEAVRLQMDALAQSNEPRPDHGLEVMYGFAITDGTESGNSLSSYFGFPSDLYHFGHFALKFKNRYPELINHTGYEVVKTEMADEDKRASVSVRAKSKIDKDSSWIFSMSRYSRGLQEPCWLTASLQRGPG